MSYIDKNKTTKQNIFTYEKVFFKWTNQIYIRHNMYF